MSKKLTIAVVIDIEILNEYNYDDFDTNEKVRYLTQEMIDQSTWPGEGIGCVVVSAEVKGA